MVNSIALYNVEKGLVERSLELNIPVEFNDVLGDNFKKFSDSQRVSNSIYVRCLRNNIRAFSACTKTRSEVSFSTRKMWKQKGTGRARVKSAASPLWRKGGILFGPRPGGRKLLFNKNLSIIAWRNLFLSFIHFGRIVCLDIDDSSFGIGSKKFSELLSICVQDIKNSCVVLVLSPDAINLARSAANIPCIDLQLFGQLDYLRLAKADKILFLKSDKELFENLVR